LACERLLEKQEADRDVMQRAMYEMRPLQLPQPILWRARVLDILGKYEGPKGATALYQQARTPDADLKQIKARAPQGREKDAQTAVETLTTAKQHASYWLGLVSFERGNFPAAVDYLQTRTLEAWPDGPWTYGAEYNLGRALEALGKPVEAAAA